MIKIGVSSCFMHPDINRSYFGPKRLSYLEGDMATYLSRPGVMALLIPDIASNLLEEWMDNIDGFVLQGGSDLAPESYNEKPIQDGRWKGDAYRDAYELKLLGMAIKRGLPVFGICRGFQLINAFYNGSLYQDIGVQLKTELEHRNALEYDKVHHPILLEEKGWLAKLYNSKKAVVNSVHHQAIKDLGEGLEILARAEDGIIEAFKLKDSKQFVLGVQWHPEFSPTLGDKVMDSELLYSAFLKEVKAKKF